MLLIHCPTTVLDSLPCCDWSFALVLCLPSNDCLVLQVGKPASFTCSFNGAKGDLFARVVAPSGAEDEALVQSLDDSNSKFCG